MLIGLGFGLMHFHQSALRMAVQEDALNQAIAAQQHEEQGYRAQMQQPANARVLQQAQFLNGLFEEKSFSWTAAIEDLERVLPAGVQVTLLEPTRAKDGRLTLHLRVSGQRERAVEMVRDMERSKRFAAPRISGENTENSQANLQTVRDTGKVSFEVLAEYNPATLEERRVEIATQKRTRRSGTGEKTPGVAETRPPHTQPAPQPVPVKPVRHGIRGRAMEPGGVNKGLGPPTNAGQPHPPGGPQ
jgi:type IV pilus assembly protein PilN